MLPSGEKGVMTYILDNIQRVFYVYINSTYLPPLHKKLVKDLHISTGKVQASEGCLKYVA